MAVYLSSVSSSSLSALFYVTIPQPQDIPIEILLLQEVTTSFTSQLGFIQASILSLYNIILSEYPSTKLGISSFSDKPVFGFGLATQGDYAYMTNLALTSSQVDIQTNLNSLSIHSGGTNDSNVNSQLEALLQLSVRTAEVGWTPGSMHIVVCITDTFFHYPPNIPPFSKPNNDDGVLDNTEDYPYPSDVRYALLSNNIIPVFIVGGSSSVVQAYQNLVNTWGFGYVASFSSSAMTDIFTEVLGALDIITSSAIPVIKDQGININTFCFFVLSTTI